MGERLGLKPFVFPEGEFVTVAQAAEYLGISEKGVLMALESGKMRTIKIPRLILLEDVVLYGKLRKLESVGGIIVD